MKSDPTAPTCVLGAGSWGTALAVQLARAGQNTRLWVYEPQQAYRLQSNRENATYLPGVRFPDPLSVHSEISDALDGCQDILIVVPSHVFAQTIDKIAPHVSPKTRFIWGTKGLDPDTGGLLHHVLQSKLGGDHSLAIISGPSFAKEVAHDLPTAITIAGSDSQFNKEFAAKIHSTNFRPYTNDDLIGVQLAGAMKNPIAVAAGMCDGLGLGANARCALITRGLAGMMRLGIKLGGKPETFSGLAGMGDLILTCTDNLSRNRRFGLALGQGVSVEKAYQQVGQVVEGKQNALLIKELAGKHNVDLPIIDQVCLVVESKLGVKQAASALLQRDLRAE